MEEKGLLLVFISDYKDGAKTGRYKGERGDGTQWWFEGAQTNDAPVKYLISKALEDHHKIEKIICIVSKKVRDKGFEEFQRMVNDYIHSSKELEAAYGGRQIDFCPVDYPESEDAISVRASEVYKKIAAADCIGGEDGAKIYIDYTGGLRDINFLMTAIIRYLEYHGVSCQEIVYSSYNRDDTDKNRIYSLRCIYDMYQLLNGVEQFVDTGNAELLQACYHDEGDRDANELLEQIIRFSHAMSLCDVGNVDKTMDQLCQSLDRFDAKADKGSFFSVMFGDLTSIIRKKLYIERGRAYSYPQLIRWCLDNNMVQQALTLYVEKMPEFYCNEGIVEFSQEEEKYKKNRKNPGMAWRTEFFYGPFYDQLVMPELKKFRERLKTGCEAMTKECPMTETLEAKKFRKLKTYMETEKEKAAIDLLVKYLEKYYKGGVPGNITMPYTGEKVEDYPKNVYRFVKCVSSDVKWYVYFYYNDKKKYDESTREMGTYEKKVVALEAAKTYPGRIPNAVTDDNLLLYNMMKYYLALKIIRNRINHASEQEAQEDEVKAINQLEKNHGICMKTEFQNIKNLIREGIELYPGNIHKKGLKITVKKDLTNTKSITKGGKKQ